MMFRQTWIYPGDRKYQLIYWRASKSDPLQLYELTTNTYGLKSSPFVAIRCFHQLATDERNRYPRAAKLLVKKSYVDDLNGGGDSLQEAKELRNELVALMSSAGYELRKWSSNDPQLLRDLPSEHLETPRTFDEDTDGTGFVKILDKENIIRVGGRIDAANLPYNARHQILLPSKGKFTELLIFIACWECKSAGADASASSRRAAPG
ncbi:Uncharacterized protein OBRU01_13815 [Operophtera brumata]|uniref:Uncharacterized protein n=1 Tax=Operophtera brumata TaxID=104452 RepID=A0A0L7L7I9_OPEBR|nr:Uncharacterized protein OBRU01_13815 [Operophtera brumata]